MSETTPRSLWPALPALAEWRDTCTTVHMWTQIAGKVRLALTPQSNHCWGVALYVTSHGLTTGPMPFGHGSCQIDFDFIHHTFGACTSRGGRGGFALEPMTVADFHREAMDLLACLGIQVRIHPRPVEVVEAIPFPENLTDCSYDPDAMRRFWLALSQAARVFEIFRAGYLGKVSPVHFFWGAFDLAVTRFSGRTAPRHPGGVPNCPDRVMHEAYSHEVSSAGFWPGTGVGDAAFYAYAYPEPQGFRDRPVAPGAAYFHENLGEFILPYEAMRAASDPDQALLRFLQTTYEAAADLAAWDRVALERAADAV